MSGLQTEVMEDRGPKRSLLSLLSPRGEPHVWPNFSHGDTRQNGAAWTAHGRHICWPFPSTTCKRQSRVASNLNVGDETIKL